MVSSIRGVVLFFKTFFFLVGSGSLMLLLLFDIAGWLGKRITLSVGGLVDGWVDGRMDGSLNFFFFFFDPFDERRPMVPMVMDTSFLMLPL